MPLTPFLKEAPVNWNLTGAAVSERNILWKKQ